MKIAVLMSTYNGHKFLDKQLETLTKQTVAEDMVVYIRDDGSSDDTFSIIDEWKEKLDIVLYKGTNAGPAMSFWDLLMNKDIHADYYAFCDQDDVWDPDKLESAVKHLQGDTHLYACNCRIIDEKGQTIKEIRLKKKPEISIQRLFISGCTQGCSMVFDDELRKYVQQIGLQCIPMHDVVLMLHALNFGTIYWDQTTHFGYRVHSNNVVAKNDKTIIKKLKTVWWNWKNSSKNSMAVVSEELIKNARDLKDDDMEFLNCMKSYKSDVVSKWKILMVRNMGDIDKSALRSFRIRVILNLL